MQVRSYVVISSVLKYSYLIYFKSGSFLALALKLRMVICLKMRMYICFNML